MNDISIDFYLMNNKNERLDLIEGEFNLFINNIKSSSKLEYDDYAIASKLVNVLKDNFIGEDISLNGAIGTSKKLKHVDNFLLKQKQNFKLFFTNN
ncbi:MAG: hypothetical protein RR533_03510, partial [Carnobacterium sp.]